MNEILTVIGERGSVNKELVKRMEDLEIRGQVENIQTTGIKLDQKTEKC